MKLLVFTCFIAIVHCYKVKAPDNIVIKYPQDTIEIPASVTIENSDFKTTISDDITVLDGVLSASQCPSIKAIRLSSLSYQYHIPKRTSSRLPLVIGTKKGAAIGKDALKMAKNLNAGVLAVTGFVNEMGYQGGVAMRNGRITPIMFDWSIDAVTCLIQLLEKKHNVNFSGWYLWGHSGAGQFAHKMAFYKEQSYGVNVPKKVKAFWSSAPGHPYLAGFDDIKERKRQPHQYQFHECNREDDRYESVSTFAKLMARDPNFYGRVEFTPRDGKGHSPIKKSLMYNLLTEKFGYVMDMNRDRSPLTIKWDVVSGSAKSVVFEDDSVDAPQVTFNKPGKYTLRVTVSDNGKKKVSDTVTVTVDDSNAPAGLPVLSVYVKKASASLKADDPGHFEIRSSKTIGGNGLAVNFDVLGPNVVAYTEETYKCIVLSYEYGRYGFVPESNVPKRMEEGTKNLYVIVHGKGKKTAALLRLKEGTGYAIDSKMSSAEILIQDQAKKVKKVIPTEGGKTLVSVDSQSFPEAELSSFQIVSKPKYGSLKFFGSNPGSKPSFAMGVYKSDRGVVCNDSFKYQVKSGSEVVADGVIELSPAFTVGPCDGSVSDPPPSNGNGNGEEEKDTSKSPFDALCSKKGKNAKKCGKIKKKKQKVCTWTPTGCIGLPVA